jgi:HemY protein
MRTIRRILGFLVVAAALMLAVAWFADRPGEVSVVWQGWRIDTSFGVLVFGAALVALCAIALARIWQALVSGPRRFLRWRRDRRRRQGYAALTSGLVAVAAGDPREARRHARRADVLLDEPPLTMLLAAQTAQLLGDEDEAKRHFRRMLDNPETAFLGLRGLITQALKSGDTIEALMLARRARDLRPRTAWVQTTLLDLETRIGDWPAAQETLRQATKHAALPPAQASRHAAAIALERARRAVLENRPEEALAQAELAWKSDPDHAAVAPFLAERYLADGRARAALRIVEQAWARSPQPELADLHARARGCGDALSRVKAAERLAALAPAHPESHLVLARAAQAARLWGEARRHLAAAIAAGGGAATAGIARRMAEIEEVEKGDQAAARGWLERAAQAPEDAGWICGACGTAHARWQAICGQCGAFDRISWTARARVAALPAATATASAPPPQGGPKTT